MGFLDAIRTVTNVFLGSVLLLGGIGLFIASFFIKSIWSIFLRIIGLILMVLGAMYLFFLDLLPQILENTLLLTIIGAILVVIIVGWLLFRKGGR